MYPQTAPATLRKTFIALHISAVVYFLLGLGALSMFPLSIFLDMAMGIGELVIIMGIGGFSVLLGVGVELVILHLKRGKNWAWVTAICLTGIYIPSLFLPLGIVALIGLLDPQSKAHCAERRTW